MALSGPRPAALLFTAALVGCGASVRGDGPSAPRDAMTDASLGPIQGCPSRSGMARGRWEAVAVPEDFSARANAVVVAVEGGVVVIGGSSERSVVTDNWRFETAGSRWSRLSSAGLNANSRYLVATWMPEAREVFLWSSLERRGVRLGLDGASRALPTDGAPRTLALRAVAVEGMVFVGGSTTEGDHDEFALYDPRADRWEPVLAPREQTSRGSYALVAAGREVLIWGGADATTGTGAPRNDGWRFDVPSRQWSAVSRVAAPAPRISHAAWWIGDSVLVWGGHNGSRTHRAGGRYFSGPDAWLPMSDLGAPGSEAHIGTYAHPAAWTGSDLYAWTLTAGGESSAGRYDPSADRWFAADPPPGAARRRESATVWSECGLYVVGGRDVQRWEFTREVLRWAP